MPLTLRITFLLSSGLQTLFWSLGFSGTVALIHAACREPETVAVIEDQEMQMIAMDEDEEAAG